MKYLVLLTVCLLSCSDSKEGNSAQYPIKYNTPDTNSGIVLEDSIDSDAKRQKSDVFEPKDAVNPPETDQNDTKSDTLDKKDSNNSQADTVSSDIAGNDIKTDTKPFKKPLFLVELSIFPPGKTIYI